VAGAFELWRRSLPFDDPPVGGFDLGNTTAHVLEGLFWTGLVLSPVTLVLVARWRRPRTWLAVVAAGFLALALLAGLERPFFPVNYLTPRGAYPDAELGSREQLVPDALWVLVGAVAVVSAGVLLDRLAGALLGRTRRAGGVRSDPAARVLSCFLVLSVAGFGMQDLVGQVTYSRYLLVLPPVVAALVLRSVPDPVPTRLARVGPVALLAALCALAVVLTAGTLRSDTARWTAAQALVDSGVAPMSIAVGQEWSGWHTAGAAVHAGRDAPGDAGWWTGMFSDASECWLVTVDDRPRDGYRLVSADRGVWVFRTEGAC
jgi:hypothetical protein